MAYVPLFGGSVGGGRDVGPAPSESAVVRTEKRFTRPVTFEDLVIFSSGDSDKASARSHTFSTTDETGWKIDGAGNAWFYGTTIIKGATVGELTVTDWITLGTGGLIRTASSGQRVEISEAAEDRITFYSGGSNESAAGFIQSTASSNSPAMWLNGPTSSGGSGGDFNYIKLQSVSYSASYGIELFSVKQDMRFYLVDNTKEIEFAYAGASLQKFAKDSVTFDSSASPGTDYIQFLPGSAGSQIKIADDNPQVEFQEHDRNAAGEYYWFHHSQGTFYLLQDRSATPDGNWDSPHPWWVSSDGQFHVGNGIDIPDGSTSAPGLALENDGNTGLYSYAANYLNVTVNGEEQAYFAYRSATARANAAFTIKGDASGDNLLKFDTDRPWYFRQANTGSTTELWLQDAGSSKKFWIVDYNGNKRVGFDMNTTTPAHYSVPAYLNVATNFTVYVNSAGLLTRSSSSRRYKSYITPMGARLANLELDPVGYLRDDIWELGFIAEDVAEQHPALALYDEEGRVEDFKDRGVMAIMAAKINRLERQVAELTAQA